MAVKRHSKTLLAAAIGLAMGLSSGAYAQETTSAINGVVSDQQGSALANQRIIIVHQPSNTRTVVNTNGSGRFLAKGLRAGGPYKIVIDSDSHQDVEQEGIYLQLGETLSLSPQLRSAGDLEEVVVTADAIMMEKNRGDSSVFNLSTIENSPSFNRDIKDIARMNPLVSISPGRDSEMSIAGNNPKYNSFTVDGVGQNDDFGLSDNGYPTLRSPVSIEALDQISVDIVPFDVRASGFSGGRVNAVTKSGTNEFHGSLFYEKATDGLSGGENPNTGNDIQLEYEEKTFGASLGGPIIQDKLFFFASYEEYDSPQSATWGPAGAGFDNSTAATVAQYNEVAQIAKDVYGVDLQGYNGNVLNEDEKLLVKLDWNINDSHRANYTYQSTEGKETRGTTFSDSQLKDSSNWYDQVQELESHSFGVFSDWSDSFSTELRISRKEVTSAPTPRTTAIGQVEVNVGGRDEIIFGSERFRHANILETTTNKFLLEGNLLLDEHELSFGIDYENIEIFNLFTESSRGVYEFRSIEDFRNRAGSIFYQNATSNIAADNAASLEMSTMALYFQDNFQLTDNFSINAGIRYERIMADDKPRNNPHFATRNNFANTENLDGKDIFLPRIGFNWDINEEMALSGGIGRFSGGKPNVWIANSFSNNGVTQTNTFLGGQTNLDITQIPQQALDNVGNGTPNGDTNSIDPSFEIPSDWRLSLNFEWALPYDIDWNLGAQYVRKDDSVAWRDLSRNDPANVVRQMADGRFAYVDRRTNDFVLVNADKDGKSKIITTAFSKAWDNGLNASFSYAYQDITDGNPGTSSRAVSNYRFNIVENRDRDLVGTSNFEVQHRFTATLNYNVEFFEGYESRFNLFWSRKSGRPFSQTMYQSNRDQFYLDHGRRSSFLPYIPNGPDDTTVVANAAEVWADLQSLGLDKYAGGFVTKNDSRNPWINSLDFSFTQEIPGFMEGHKGSVQFTLVNVFSFLDDTGIYDNDLGVVRYHNFANVSEVTARSTDDGRYTYSVRPTSPGFDAEASSWRMKLGVRYTF